MTVLQKDLRIVIPAFKASNIIQKCIEAILDATTFHKSREIIIVDNGHNPELLLLLKNYPVTILKRNEIPSAAYARNEGSKGFLNGILVFLDSDVICERNCIMNLIEPLQNDMCDATIGNYSKNINGLSFSQKYKQLYINHIYGREGSTIKNDFWTAICSVDAKVFHDLEGFNTNFKGASGEDQEFGFRLTKKGYKVLSVTNANGQHLNPYCVFSIIRNDFKKGLTAIKNSLENKVPLSDNRHSKSRDILSVFFAFMALASLIIILINPTLLVVSVISFLIWFLCRIYLSMAFLKSGGLIFFLRACMLMFCLDLVRFACVVVGLANNRLSTAVTKKKICIVSIPIKS